MTALDNGLTTVNSCNIVNSKVLEVQHRKNKVRSKANFMCTRYNLLLLLKEVGMPNHHEKVQESCKKMNLLLCQPRVTVT